MKFLIQSFSAFCLLAFVFSSCSSDSVDPPATSMATLWEGSTLTFSKEADAEPTEAANQDRITSNVWITRGNEGGQIYNAVNESSADKNNSPSNTLWAIGNISESAQLEFKSFREAVSMPREIIGEDLVVFLTEDNIMLSLKFTSWDSGKAGGFSYERSTP